MIGVKWCTVGGGGVGGLIQAEGIEMWRKLWPSLPELRRVGHVLLDGNDHLLTQARHVSATMTVAVMRNFFLAKHYGS